MSRARSLPSVMTAPTHNGAEKRCVVMTEAAIHTVTLPEGSFAALVLSLPTNEIGAIVVMDREEIEAHILLLRNAIEDAERIDAGKFPMHAAPSLRRS